MQYSPTSSFEELKYNIAPYLEYGDDIPLYLDAFSISFRSLGGRVAVAGCDDLRVPTLAIPVGATHGLFSTDSGPTIVVNGEERTGYSSEMRVGDDGSIEAKDIFPVLTGPGNMNTAGDTDKGVFLVGDIEAPGSAVLGLPTDWKGLQGIETHQDIGGVTLRGIHVGGDVSLLVDVLPPGQSGTISIKRTLIEGDLTANNKVAKTRTDELYVGGTISIG